MKYYKIYGMNFISDFELLQLAELSSGDVGNDVQFTISEGWIPKEYKKDQTCYSIIDLSVSVLSNSTCWLLVENGVRITYERKPGAKDAWLSAYLLGWGIAILGFQRNTPAIHCSCVWNEAGAILIAGRSGSGKSTITQKLLCEGYGLLADDMVLAAADENGTVYAQPGFPYQKLCRDVVEGYEEVPEGMIYVDEAKDKYLVPYKGHFPEEAVTVRAVILLGWGESRDIVCKEVVGLDKLYAMIDSLFLRALFREELYRKENVNSCLKLAAGMPIYEVVRSKENSTVAEVINKIKEIISFQEF